ncbi:MAG: SDR family oxidoreductase [Chloroflexi bacterium]|nr:MAG: SDR family oxidoreductase [Chloroflexota bacterium]
MASARDPSALPLAGRTLLVTGASSGTGLAGVLAWHKLGADIVVGSRSAASCAGVADRMGNVKVHPLVADLGDPSSVDAALDHLRASGVAPTDIVHFAAGGLEPILRPLLRITAGLRRMAPSEARDRALAEGRAELERLVASTAAAGMAVNYDGPRRLLERLGPALPRGGQIILFASVWSEMAGAGCPAFYHSVADSKTRLERWLDTQMLAWASRDVTATVVVAHVISDTSTGKLIDRNIAPLMSAQDQSEFRAAYVTTEQTIAATSGLLLRPASPAGMLRRVYQVGSDELTDAIAPEVRAVASRVPL